MLFHQESTLHQVFHSQIMPLELHAPSQQTGEKMVNFSAFNYSRAIFLQEKHEAVNMQVIYDTKCSIKKRV
jgi:hypothetical protein